MPESMEEREARLGLRTVIEVEPSKTNRAKVWWQMVTIESSGTRHVLTSWREDTPAGARRAAKREGVRLVEVEA